MGGVHLPTFCTLNLSIHGGNYSVANGGCIGLEKSCMSRLPTAKSTLAMKGAN